MAFVDKNTYQIEKRDIGCTEDNKRKKENVFEPLGYVQPNDVGKLCKKTDGIWYVENEKQFKKRRND